MRDKTEISPKYLTVFWLLYWQVKYEHRLKNVRYFGLDRNLRYLVKCYEATYMNVYLYRQTSIRLVVCKSNTYFITISDMSMSSFRNISLELNQHERLLQNCSSAGHSS